MGERLYRDRVELHLDDGNIGLGDALCAGREAGGRARMSALPKGEKREANKKGGTHVAADRQLLDLRLLTQGDLQLGKELVTVHMARCHTQPVQGGERHWDHRKNLSLFLSMNFLPFSSSPSLSPHA